MRRQLLLLLYHEAHPYEGASHCQFADTHFEKSLSLTLLSASRQWLDRPEECIYYLVHDTSHSLRCILYENMESSFEAVSK